MAMVTMMVEEVHERTCRQQQERQDPKQVGPVLCQQEKECDGKKTGQNPFAADGHASGMFRMTWLRHDDTPCRFSTLKPMDIVQLPGQWLQIV